MQQHYGLLIFYKMQEANNDKETCRVCENIFNRIQTYTFENIDKFSSSSLVARLAADVSNVQMPFPALKRKRVDKIVCM